jgi:hypothetical protein
VPDYAWGPGTAARVVEAGPALLPSSGAGGRGVRAASAGHPAHSVPRMLDTTNLLPAVGSLG